MTTTTDPEGTTAMTHISFQRLSGEDRDQYGDWGVKVSADLGKAGGYAGQEVEVTKRSGATKRVVLGTRIDIWNGGRAAVYAIAHKPRSSEKSPGWSSYRDGYDVPGHSKSEPKGMFLTDAELKTVVSALGVDIAETDGSRATWELLSRISEHLDGKPIPVPEYVQG